MPNVLVPGGCRERKWKIAQAKRFAKLVSKSNLDVEGRERARRKEELLTLKKRAAWIAKEVKVCSITVWFITNDHCNSDPHCHANRADSEAQKRENRLAKLRQIFAGMRR